MELKTKQVSLGEKRVENVLLGHQHLKFDSFYLTERINLCFFKDFNSTSLLRLAIYFLILPCILLLVVQKLNKKKKKQLYR